VSLFGATFIPKLAIGKLNDLVSIPVTIGIKIQLLCFALRSALKNMTIANFHPVIEHLKKQAVLFMTKSNLKNRPWRSLQDFIQLVESLTMC